MVCEPRKENQWITTKVKIIKSKERDSTSNHESAGEWIIGEWSSDAKRLNICRDGLRKRWSPHGGGGETIDGSDERTSYLTKNQGNLKSQISDSVQIDLGL